VRRINELGPNMRRRYGGPVRKVCLRPGTTCPNRDGALSRGGCLFCAEPEPLPPAPVPLQLDRALARLDPDIPVIAYLQDHSATYLPAARLDQLLTLLWGHPRVVGISLGTRPDCLPTPVLQVLARHARPPADPGEPLLVELGLQTADDETLALLNRQHTVADFDEAVAALHEIGAAVCAHVVLGLPRPGGDPDHLEREAEAHARRTALHLGEVGVDAVKLHNCHVLRHTTLERLHAEGRYTPPDLSCYLGLLVEFLEHLPGEVEVHRLVGESPQARLVAPAFTAKKASTLQKIRQALDQRSLTQGSRWPGRLPGR
jgi:uncharacterized protein